MKPDSRMFFILDRNTRNLSLCGHANAQFTLFDCKTGDAKFDEMKDGEGKVSIEKVKLDSCHSITNHNTKSTHFLLRPARTDVF